MNEWLIVNEGFYMKERRVFSRIKFVADVQLIHKDKSYVADMLDISLRGALILPHETLAIKAGELCELKFALPETDIVLQFTMELVHSAGDNLGFKFLSEDVETMVHLRQLLSLNLGNPEKIAEELPFLIT